MCANWGLAASPSRPYLTETTSQLFFKIGIIELWLLLTGRRGDDGYCGELWLWRRALTCALIKLLLQSDFVHLTPSANRNYNIENNEFKALLTLPYSQKLAKFSNLLSGKFGNM